MAHELSDEGLPAEDDAVVAPAVGSPAPRRHPFPGPENARAALRVTLDTSAYADLTAHARESLDCEVCGVLVGDTGEDDNGVFVHIKGVIRGTNVRQGQTHVTFTHETWNAIYKKMDENYPAMGIMGWYHSHPGFGVQFSDMDRFIHGNFFTAPTQVALVTDPLGGDEALLTNSPEGLAYLDRFWVEGRERHCLTPPSDSREGDPASTVTPDRQALERMELRMNQLLRAVDDQHKRQNSALLALTLLLCAFVATAVAFTFFHHFFRPTQPPELRQYVPVLLRVGDKTLRIGVGVYDWRVEPDGAAVTPKQEAPNAAPEETDEYGRPGRATASPPPSLPSDTSPPPNSEKVFFHDT